MSTFNSEIKTEDELNDIRVDDKLKEEMERLGYYVLSIYHLV